MKFTFLTCLPLSLTFVTAMEGEPHHEISQESLDQLLSLNEDLKLTVLLQMSPIFVYKLCHLGVIDCDTASRTGGIVVSRFASLATFPYIENLEDLANLCIYRNDPRFAGLPEGFETKEKCMETVKTMYSLSGLEWKEIQYDNPDVIPSLRDAHGSWNMDFFRGENSVELWKNVILRRGDDVNSISRGPGFKTAIDWATGGYDSNQDNNFKLFKFLLIAGADVNKRSAFNDTPLRRAVAWGNEKITRLLILSGADVNAADIDGNTALQTACLHGGESTTRMLLDAGASINAQNNDGYTPLMRAVRENVVNIVRMLLDAGADISTKDGKSALDVVSENTLPDIVKLLNEKGAR